MAVRVNMRLTERQSKVLRVEAERRGLTLSELMRRIMDAVARGADEGGGS
jgi:hypothetical protein